MFTHFLIMSDPIGTCITLIFKSSDLGGSGTFSYLKSFFIFNLINKDKLKIKFKLTYDEKDAIGRRYRRQDALGTPYCITIDHQSIEDNTVTVRERDSMKQERIKVDLIEEFLVKSLDISNWLQ